MANTVDSYRKQKIKMLSRDFYITLTDEELTHMNELTSEVSIDQYSLTIINNHWDKK